MTRLHKPPSFRATSSMCVEQVAELTQQVCRELGMGDSMWTAGRSELIPTKDRLAYHSTMSERIKALPKKTLALNREFFDCQINYHEKRATQLVAGIISGKNIRIQGS